MTAQLARMTQMLILSPSTSNIGSTTKLHQSITSRMAETLVPSSGGSGGEGSYKTSEGGEADAGKRRV